jgi:glycosyltransferase involved in cell wall biosynthesis
MIAVNARFLTQPLTGVQRFALEISRALQSLCGKNNILFFSPSNILLQSEAKELNVEIIGKHTGHLWEQIDLPRHLKKNGNPLLINLCNVAPIFYSNKLSTLHDITYIRYPHTYSKAFRWFYRITMPLVLKTSKHIFTVSEFSKKEITSHYHIPQNKITVVYNAVDKKFRPQPDDALKSENYLLAVSSVKESKNFALILNAFEAFSKQRDDLQLFIVGDLKQGNFSNIDLNRFVNHPRIKFLGRVDDNQLIKLYSNANAFLFPSLYEGFGIPVLEAQACGCSVIASNAASLPEVLQDSAELVNPQDPADFIRAISKMVTHSEYKKQLIDKGFQNLERFSWEKSGNIVLNEARKAM